MSDGIMKLDKSKRNKKDSYKPIPETKISKPEQTYRPDNEQSDRQNEKSKLEQKNNLSEGRRKKSGYSKSYRMIRVSSETAAKASAIKTALYLSSLDDVVAKGLDKVVSELNSDQRRLYQVFLDVERKKYEK